MAAWAFIGARCFVDVDARFHPGIITGFDFGYISPRIQVAFVDPPAERCAWLFMWWHPSSVHTANEPRPALPEAIAIAHQQMQRLAGAATYSELRTGDLDRSVCNLRAHVREMNITLRRLRWALSTEEAECLPK